MKKKEKLDKKIEKYQPKPGRIPDNDNKRRKLHDKIEEILSEIEEKEKDIKETDKN